MRLRVLGCYGGEQVGFRLTSFLLNDSILLDAGSPASVLTLEEQHRIRHICVSHTHLDHIKDIAFMADNRSVKRFSSGSIENKNITIHALAVNNQILRDHFLNGHIWPDFTAIPNSADGILKLHDIESEMPFDIDAVRITPITVNHPVPCTGFLLDQHDTQFIYSADTGNTDRLWEIASAQNNLQGIIIDCSFTNANQFLADISGHMTPQGLMKDLKKLKQLGSVPIYLYHMKPESLKIIIDEVAELDVPDLRMLRQDDILHV
ncbi:3',5'-cyclic-nucleotide phosphodiesterase [Mariprofundus ferrooxydans]|nr:3',5'-cyclic-nucleotide phosphodiesterase [Mariprofundus ferrooxydans]